MPHSSLKYKGYDLGFGFRNCSCGQTFGYGSERELEMKIRLHRKFCSNPPKGECIIGVSKNYPIEKAKKLKEHYKNEVEETRKLYE